ncbi:hypothetical protein [Campylobacter pinnipediorum]|nr:hypothetical protein [Campylobacter pinnipediorum]
MIDKERTIISIKALADIDLLKLFKDMRKKFKQVKQSIKDSGY